MNPGRMPRLVRDTRRRALKVFLLKCAACCAAAAAAAVSADAWQKALKRRGAAELERMEREMAELFPPSSDVMVELRGKIAEAGRRTRGMLSATGYAAPKDMDYLAETRASGNSREAEGYLSEYRNALERRKTAKENLRKEGEKTFHGLDETLGKESREWDAARRGMQERELGAAIARFAEANGAAVAVPGFWHKALADAHAAFGYARAWIEANPDMSRPVVVRRTLAEWNRRLDNAERELGDCDRAALSAYESLARLPFGGAEQLEKARVRLAQAYGKFVAAVSNAKKNCAAATAAVDGKYSSLAVEIDSFAKELNRLEEEGGDFVNLAGFSLLAEKFNRARTAWEESRDGYLKRLDGECARAENVKSSALTLLAAMETAGGGDVEALQSLCEKAGSETAKLSAPELEKLETEGRELSAAAASDVDAIADEIRKEASEVKRSVPDWDVFSSGLMEKYEGLKSDLARLCGDADSRLGELAISSGRDAAAYVKAYGTAKKALEGIVSDIPAAVRATNGAEASAARKEYEKHRALAAGAGEIIAELDRKFDEARRGGTVNTPKFAAQDFQTLVRDRCSWAVYSFGCWLKIAPAGTHKVEILAGKSMGAVYEKNKNARTVKLDIAAACGGERHSASMEFSNRTPTALSPVLSFECDSKQGYEPVDFDIQLKCGAKRLDRTTMTSWNVGLLDFEIRIDGKRVDNVFLKQE